MAEITAAMVKQLRDQTGAGMMECKAALTEANGNMDEATTLLRKRGLAQAAKRAGRATAQGVIGSYIHMGGRIGVLVEVNCESDFVARTDDFNNLVKEVAMHIAAADPKWVRREEVPAEAIEKERSIYRAQMENSGKPPAVIENWVATVQARLPGAAANPPVITRDAATNAMTVIVSWQQARDRSTAAPPHRHTSVAYITCCL